MTDAAQTAQRRLMLRRQGLVDRQAQTPQDRLELTEIAHALLRLESGAWGRCESCGGAIGRQRLLAVPEARYCLGCAPSPD